MNQYLEALCKEIKEVAAIMKAKGRKLDTVYIGGGTPTTLEPEQLKVLLDALMENFCCENLAEFTIEAGRPDSITREKLMMIRNYPITRISVNPQTMNQETLDIIGRRHTVEETKQAFMLARECGFDNINMEVRNMSEEAKWYVVHTYSGYENKVKADIEKTIENRNLQDQILEVLIPLQTVVEEKNLSLIHISEPTRH